MNEYGTKVLKEYYKDYLNSLPLGSNFNLTEEQFMIKINEGAKHFIKNVNCYRIKNDDSTGMDVFETEYINYSNSYNFINILGYGSKIIKGFNDKEKLYFVLPIPNEYKDENVIDQIKNYVNDINEFKNFYPWTNENSTIDINEINNKKEELQKDNKFPVILTSVGEYQKIYICADILEHMMSKNNGKLRKTIYYSQYDNNLNEMYYIINNDIIDPAFIGYFMLFMKGKIIFTGENIEIAFINKLIDKIFLNVGIDVSTYKNVYDNKLNNEIYGTDVKTKLKVRDFEMEDGYEKEDKLPIQKRIENEIKKI